MKTIFLALLYMPGMYLMDFLEYCFPDSERIREYWSLIPWFGWVFWGSLIGGGVWLLNR